MNENMSIFEVIEEIVGENLVSTRMVESKYYPGETTGVLIKLNTKGIKKSYENRLSSQLIERLHSFGITSVDLISKFS